MSLPKKPNTKSDDIDNFIMGAKDEKIFNMDDSDIPVEDNLLTGIVSREEKRNRNKTYYLDIEVIRLVSRHAKAQKVSESRLVNDVLKHVLENIK